MCSLLAIVASNLSLGGRCLASLMLVTTCDPLGHGPHVDHCFFCFPSWLQLLTTILIIATLILVVRVLHLLCLCNYLQPSLLWLSCSSLSSFSSLLATIANNLSNHCDIDLSCSNLASLVLATAHDFLYHNPHVDCHLLCLLF